MCIFCEIVKGNIHSYKIYEDNEFLAFLDISQATDGHVLVIPKKHFANILEIDDDILAKISVLTKKLSLQICKNLQIDNCNILNNYGPIAGQSVNHFHFHIIPRYKENDVIIKFSKQNKSEEEMMSLANKLKKTCQ
ncbi:MAG TPA: HIT family protein [Acholeplasmataceae bacterium]|nr:HIT family protein [Acholeplasmataceae bacterium]